jgi:hypothetical protein
MRLLTTSLLLAMLAGCNADRPAATSESEADPAPPAAPSTSPPPAQGDGVTMRYACADGNKVDIVGGDTARVALSDGRTVELPRVDGRSPPLYSDATLQFAVGSEGGVLAGDDGAPADCTAE